LQAQTHTHIYTLTYSPQALKHTIDIEINGTHATCANKLISHSYRSETLFFLPPPPHSLPPTKHSHGMLRKEDDDRDLNVDDDDTNRARNKKKLLWI
jgi:hypothetical protein